MQNLSGSVGKNGVNFRHDVALVQALLTIARRPAPIDSSQRHYMYSIYGSADGHTIDAIRRFQSDRARIASGGATTGEVGRRAEQPSGNINEFDADWLALVAAMPTEYRDLRVLPGSVTVYVADSPERLDAVIKDAETNWQLHPDFVRGVTTVMRALHKHTGIAISVATNGGLRSFQEQQRQLTKKTSKAGPGESLHCYGRAVDLGFDGLKWMRPNSVLVRREGWWLHQLKAQSEKETKFFWKVLRLEGEANGLFRGPKDDLPHLQAFEDSSIDMAERFAALLTSHTNVARPMVWEGRKTPHGRLYKCDLGFGGELFEVGSSPQIWGHGALITTAMLNKARGHKPGTAGGATGDEVRNMQEALRKEFVWAEENYLSFTA